MKNTLRRNYRSLKKVDDFYRAEIRLNKYDFFYLVKLKQLNGNEACFFIRQDSVIFNKLKAGKALEIKYWTNGTTKTEKFIKTKVKNIEKQNQELLNGHYLIYISIPRSEDYAVTQEIVKIKEKNKTSYKL